MLGTHFEKALREEANAEMDISLCLILWEAVKSIAR
jgi:hypothetical protein